MNNPNRKRVLALDVRPRSFGFVVFEGSHELLDWGVRSFRHGANAVKVPLRPKLERLLCEFEPDIIVMKRPIKAKSGRMVIRIQKLAKVQRIPIRLVSRVAVRKTFSDSNRNKHQIATALAASFPELVPRLPPKRKPWQSEDYRMNIFDAAAVGIAYFDGRAIREPGAGTQAITPSQPG